jgi:NAD(P)-dependent dehydrogenase (short-subunit alcohol dehydrogenase family)
MKELAGRVAVITGGGSERGIGRATGALLAEHGMKLVLADVNGAALAATVEELRSRGAEVLGVETDVSDYASVKHLATTAYEHYGEVNVVLLNAGIGGGGALFDDDMESWHRVIGINFLGVLHGIKAFVPRMIESGAPGHVLATSSGAGAHGVMYTGAGYATTKQAVCTLMECLYGQLRDQGSQIRTTVVFPPLARSNLAGDPSAMDATAEVLAASGVPTVLVEPEVVAAFTVEAIREESFWVHPTHEQDERITKGALKAQIDWQDDIIRARADAIIRRSAPDPYLWGRI